jgi:hypothetical protein
MNWNRRRNPSYQKRRNPYRQNQYRHKRDYSYGGNFRRPTLGQCRQYLDEWEAEGVTKFEDFNEFEFENETEAELAKIRWSEANKYWNDHEEALKRYDEAVAFQKEMKSKGVEGLPELPAEVAETLKKGKPVVSFPTGDDYGDFTATNKDGAIRYLTQFYSKNAELAAAGKDERDPAQFPFLPRYAEAVALLGLPEVAKIRQHVEKLHIERNIARAKEMLEELKAEVEDAEAEVEELAENKARIIKIGNFIDIGKDRAEAIAAKAARSRAKARKKKR